MCLVQSSGEYTGLLTRGLLMMTLLCFDLIFHSRFDKFMYLFQVGRSINVYVECITCTNNSLKIDIFGMDMFLVGGNNPLVFLLLSCLLAEVSKKTILLLQHACLSKTTINTIAMCAANFSSLFTKNQTT